MTYAGEVDSRLLNDFKEENVIGKGGYGCVLTVLCNIDGQHYAMKKVILKDDSMKSYEFARREVLGMAQLYHKNIVRYHTAWLEKEPAGLLKGLEDDDISSESIEEAAGSEDDDILPESSKKAHGPMLCIQQELCYGSLGQLLEKLKDENRILEQDKAWDYFKQLVYGVDYIHSKEIRHGDLSPANVFFDEMKEVVKIGDFGLASLVGEGVLTEGEEAPMTVYCAPELKFGNFSLYSDIYSLGVILFEMLCGATTRMEWFGMVRRLNNAEFPDCITGMAKCLILEMTDAEPTMRPTTKTIIGLW